jgi:hypothetical protein
VYEGRDRLPCEKEFVILLSGAGRGGFTGLAERKVDLQRVMNWQRVDGFGRGDGLTQRSELAERWTDRERLIDRGL